MTGGWVLDLAQHAVIVAGRARGVLAPFTPPPAHPRLHPESIYLHTVSWSSFTHSPPTPSQRLV